jgi:hypothetical protein
MVLTIQAGHVLSEHPLAIEVEEQVAPIQEVENQVQAGRGLQGKCAAITSHP